MTAARKIAVEVREADKRTSNERYADALEQVRREAQARYVRTYGHASALYSEKGPFR